MYNFKEKRSSKRYRHLKRGWYKGKTFQAKIKSPKSGELRQYINVDFEIIDDEKNKDTLVPSFFSYNKNGGPDPKFMDMGEAAGLTEDYGNDLNRVLRDLIDRELMIYVVHRYKKGRRRERVIDFKPIPESIVGLSDQGYSENH